MDSNKTENSTPKSSNISVYQKGDIGYITQQNGTRLQSMHGFDEEFQDIVDYIIKITHRIWEEKAIGHVYHYYLHNAVIHTNSGDIYGREAVVAGTIQGLAALPDRRLYGDDVIWKHDPDDVFYSSHRITHEGRNTGYTNYAPPTGHKVRYRAIADCIIKDNQIIEEWLVRDELLFITQLGLDPYALAKEFASVEKDITDSLTAPGEIERLRGQLPPRVIPQNTPQNDLETWIRNMFHEIWNWRLLNRVDLYFDERLHVESASGRTLHGLGSYKSYILSLMAPLPDLAMSVDHFCAIPDGTNTFRTATRWSLQGTHTGHGIYGKPTGKQVSIFGITHHLIRDNKIVREWTLFDEFAILKQIHAPD